MDENILYDLYTLFPDLLTTFSKGFAEMKVTTSFQRLWGYAYYFSIVLLI